MIVSTPLIAILQGTRVLYEYRNKHHDAPRPVMPARGVAVAIERASPKQPLLASQQASNNTNNNTLMLNTQRPLQLLVVGDSLAAGVGISKSGTPVLPESIARALSKASGGRPVYWTCVGTPGVSASQIVQDIDQIKPYTPGRLEMFLKEWQAKRKKWQERQALKRRLTEVQDLDEDEETPSKAEKKKPKNYIKEWWKLILLSRQEKKMPKQIQEVTRNMFQEWWSQVTNRFKAEVIDIKENLNEMKEIVQAPPDTVLDQQQEAENKTALSSREVSHELVQKGNLFRRDAVNPEVVAQYDIAVVLFGLNDLKDAFMPHMTSGTNSSLKEGTDRVGGGLHNQLQGVLHALEDKMGEMDLKTDHSKDPVSTTKSGRTTASTTKSDGTQRNTIPNSTNHIRGYKTEKTSRIVL